ncbi:MAG: riboflavin synthase [Acidobacteriota bacterium]|nr:riboflavin synthase [Acidobacteriota bacterium]
MFTGIVTERGRVVEVPGASDRGGARLVVGHSPALAAKLDLGASIAVAGVCLTVVEQDEVDGAARSVFDLSPETLSRTTLGALRAGDEVNLEPPLSAGEPLGGHWVQGHVDTTTRVARVEEQGDHRVVTFNVPAGLETGVVLKGSITIDGVSLTVASLDERTFDVALIPHTLEVTTLGGLKPGDRVNVEGDVLARYVQKAVEAAVAAALESK